MKSHFDHELEIFGAAGKLPDGPERMAYLNKACAGDDALRRRILALIKAGEDAGTYLQQLPAGARTALVAPDAASRGVVPITEKPGDTIGRYNLLQQIGEGGCGVVFMAEQEEPIRRRVALKVIKLGMDTRQVVARFEAERQALALMDHPNMPESSGTRASTRCAAPSVRLSRRSRARALR